MWPVEHSTGCAGHRVGGADMGKACETRSAVPGTRYMSHSGMWVPGGHCQVQAVRSRGGLGGGGTKGQGPRPDFGSLGMSGWRSTGYPSTRTRLRALPVPAPTPPRQDGGVRAGRIRCARRGCRSKGDVRRVPGGWGPQALLPRGSSSCHLPWLCSHFRAGDPESPQGRAAAVPGLARGRRFLRKKSWPPPPPGTVGGRRSLPLPRKKPAALVKA